MSKAIGSLVVTSNELIIRTKIQNFMGTLKERILFIPEDAILEMVNEEIPKGATYVGGNVLKKVVKICLYVEQDSCTMHEGDVYNFTDEEVRKYHNDWQRDFNTPKAKGTL